MYALVRGATTISRLGNNFTGKSYGMDLEIIHRAALHPVQITDLSHERFGTSDADY